MPEQFFSFARKCWQLKMATKTSEDKRAAGMNWKPDRLNLLPATDFSLFETYY